MKNDRIYMEMAIEEARFAIASGEIPVGAVLVHDEDGVLAHTHNKCEQTADATAHAEILAIREAGKRLGHWRLACCTLYVTLEPCPMCAGAIVAARLSRLVYGATDARAGAVESVFNISGHPSINHHLSVTAGVMEDDCKALLKSFFEGKRQNGFLHCGGHPAML